MPMCSETEFWLLNEVTAVTGLTSEETGYLRTYWWQPKCCRHGSNKDKDNDYHDDNGDNGDESTTVNIIPAENKNVAFIEDKSSTTAVATVASTFGNAVAFLTAWTIMATM